MIQNHIKNMTPEICKASRALVNLTQKELALMAGIATPTIADFERGARKPHGNNLKSIIIAFENKGLDFIEEGGEIIGIFIRRKNARTEESINLLGH
ncbi:helix-turn-helix domain-containing protein [Erwinia psidii]|nr:helix-turn-helix transcriptional regulator [Erwinia psidii]